jgi:hypothetical protein
MKVYNKRQSSAKDPNGTVKRPNTAEEHQELVCKDETEEVVFD